MARVDALSGLAYTALDAGRRRRLIRVDEPGGRHGWTNGATILTRTTEALLQQQMLTIRYASTVDVLAVPTPAGERALAAADERNPRTPTSTKE